MNKREIDDNAKNIKEIEKDGKKMKQAIMEKKRNT